MFAALIGFKECERDLDHIGEARAAHRSAGDHIVDHRGQRRVLAVQLGVLSPRPGVRQQAS